MNSIFGVLPIIFLSLCLFPLLSILFINKTPSSPYKPHRCPPYNLFDFQSSQSGFNTSNHVLLYKKGLGSQHLLSKSLILHSCFSLPLRLSCAIPVINPLFCNETVEPCVGLLLLERQPSFLPLFPFCPVRSSVFRFCLLQRNMAGLLTFFLCISDQLSSRGMAGVCPVSVYLNHFYLQLCFLLALVLLGLLQASVFSEQHQEIRSSLQLFLLILFGEENPDTMNFFSPH